MAQIIDLDVLVPEDKKAVLGGVTYVLPGDMPMEIFLRLQRASQLQDQDGMSEVDLAEALRDGLFELFSYKLEESNDDGRDRLRRTLDSLGIRTFMSLFSELYKDEAEAEVTDPPTKEVVDGTASTNPSPTTP